MDWVTCVHMSSPSLFIFGDTYSNRGHMSFGWRVMACVWWKFIIRILFGDFWENSDIMRLWTWNHSSVYNSLSQSPMKYPANVIHFFNVSKCKQVIVELSDLTFSTLITLVNKSLDLLMIIGIWLSFCSYCVGRWFFSLLFFKLIYLF